MNRDMFSESCRDFCLGFMAVVIGACLLIPTICYWSQKYDFKLIDKGYIYAPDKTSGEWVKR